ncbi:MAG: S8 family serine peptidase [Bacteroidetes bacterium]|nr:S8 family serine peptidase [Bacteroidota bacterium]
MKKICLLISLLVFIAITGFAQKTSVKDFDSKYLNWYNLDPTDDGVLGTSVDKAYKELLKDKKPRKIVTVAIIDGGVDISIDDLKGMIWINPKETAGNAMDDDHNGYIDDMHGWNYIGNAKGENIIYENYEYTRIYKLGINNKDYKIAEKFYNEELTKRMSDKVNFDKFEEKLNTSKQLVKDKFGIEVTKAEDLKDLSSKDKKLAEAISFLKEKYEDGFTEEGFARVKNRNYEFLQKFLNLKYSPRTIVGDNPEDMTSLNYGNADVCGPRANHGTCLAGIIAGIRDNGTGVNGIAASVRIMALRTTPSGDERDKDVALAIRYAVDNGADIINMSFGKIMSPQKKFVDDAIRYAESKNVLIIHAAGNSGEDIEEFVHYPSAIYLDKKEATNFISVGSCGMEKGENMASIFSNYSKDYVDIFAPGENIVSLDTSNTYSVHSGTSQAAPVVTGIAALVLSYYPELSPQDLKEILLESSLNLKKQEVLIPDLKNKERKKVSFGKLSKCGGIVNAYNALKKAETFKKKKK